MSERRYPVTVTAPARAQTQNARGEWVPAIPLPWYRLVGVQCGCGRRFRFRRRRAVRRYREHYAYAHILEMP
jgi:hypothetical protein